MDTAEYQALEALTSQLAKHLAELKAGLDYLLCNTLLHPRSLYSLTSLKRDVGIEEQQLRLYKGELVYLASPQSHSHPTFALLVVAKQPFPKPIKKNIKVCGADGNHEDPTLVKLLRFRFVSFTFFHDKLRHRHSRSPF